MTIKNKMTVFHAGDTMKNKTKEATWVIRHHEGEIFNIMDDMGIIMAQAQKEEAEIIVREHNAFEGLLEALKTLVAEDDKVVSAKSPHTIQSIKKAQDAITEAEAHK